MCRRPGIGRGGTECRAYLEARVERADRELSSPLPLGDCLKCVTAWRSVLVKAFEDVEQARRRGGNGPTVLSNEPALEYVPQVAHTLVAKWEKVLRPENEAEQRGPTPETVI